MRVLLVEDDAAIARFVKKGLEAERYRVDTAADGEQALAMAQAGVYRLVLLDLLLPRLSGIEVCRQLRARGAKMPILILTAKDSVEDKVLGLRVGADDYLAKPFAFEELLARMQALLRRPANLDMATTIQVGDLVLDTAAHEVRRAGSVVLLTAMEFALLEYLIRRPGRVASRAAIEQDVWGYEHDSSTNVVDVYIRRLRRKIDCDFTPALIHTVRGVGYVVKP